jgi:tetratricopeptide (TPR) repeat protein
VSDLDAVANDPPVIRQSSTPEQDAPTDSTWQGRPASLVDMFVGRDEQLKEIAKGFRKDSAVMISGPSGIGKSRLAAEFAHRSGAPGFWTTAGATVEETLAALVQALFIRIENRTDAELAGEVRRLLEAFPGTTLWVIDNLTDADQADAIFEACGQVRPLIVLGSSAGVTDAGAFTLIALEALTPEAALKLIGVEVATQSNQPESSVQVPAELTDLVEYVGRSPVAVELLRGLLMDGDSPSDLLNELQKTVVDSTDGPLDDDGDELGGHMLSAAAVALGRLPASVRQYLAPLAYTGDAPMSRDLLASLVALEGDELLDVIRACSKRALLSWYGGSVRIHPIVTAAISTASANSKSSGGVGRSLKRAVGKSKGSDHDALESVLRRAMGRIATANRESDQTLRYDIAHYNRIMAWSRTRSDLSNLRIDFVGELAVAYHSLGRARQAVSLTEESLEAREESLGIDHPSTIAARNNLASVYQSSGRIDEAIAVHEKTLAEAERSLGPDHPTTLASRQNLATAHRAAGRVNQAVPLYEQAVASREKLLGPEHPDTLAGRNMLASAYQASGQIHKALPLYEKTLQLRERILGHDHPDTLATRSNLATAYQSSGRLGEALELYEDTLEARKRLFGDEDRRTLLVKNNLATAFHSDGRLGLVLEMYEETLEARTRTLGDDHIGTLTSRNNLASARRATGNLRDALMMYEQNIVDRIRILGPEHPKTLTSMNNAAAARSEVGNVEEAIPAFEEVLEVAERVLGKIHPISVTCTANLAAAYRAMGRTQDALDLEGVPTGDSDD